MSLTHPTASGWVLFGYCLIVWITLIVGLVRRHTMKQLSNTIIGAGVSLAWLLWLVTP